MGTDLTFTDYYWLITTPIVIFFLLVRMGYLNDKRKAEIKSVSNHFKAEIESVMRSDEIRRKALASLSLTIAQSFDNARNQETSDDLAAIRFIDEMKIFIAQNKLAHEQASEAEEWAKVIQQFYRLGLTSIRAHDGVFEQGSAVFSCQKTFNQMIEYLNRTGNTTGDPTLKNIADDIKNGAIPYNKHPALESPSAKPNTIKQAYKI